MISTKNIKQKNCFHHWNVSWAANHHIRRISERSCITEDWSNDSALPSQEQITFQNILNRRKKITILLFSWINTCSLGEHTFWMAVYM